MWNKHLVRRDVVVEGEGRAVFDAFCDRVFVQITFIVLTAEGLESAFAVGRLVDWCAGKSDEARLRQTSHKIISEIAGSRAMRFVDKNKDVLARIQVGRHIAKLVDHRHHDSAIIVSLLIQ